MKIKFCFALLCLALTCTCLSSHAAARVKEYVETVESKNKELLNKAQLEYVEQQKKRVQDLVKFEGVDLKNLRKKNLSFEAPGFMSARQVAVSATVIGPITNSNSIRINDLIYLRWTGTSPQEGEIYATVTPALVLQHKEDPTEFEIGVPNDMNTLPKNYRQAGYLYETTGLVKIVQITQGMVEARVINLRGQLKVGDRIIPPLPVYQSVPPVYSDGELTASIVSGHPVDRLSTTIGSYVYINRGMRDGVKLGQVFSAMEGVKLDTPVHETPQKYMGSVKVIYVSDAYSTAVIIKQFDLIRIGGLIRSDTAAIASSRESTQENLPNMEALPVTQGDFQAPEELKQDTPKALSELDLLERSVKNRTLTPDERLRLNDLHQQATNEQTSPPEDNSHLSIEESNELDSGEVPSLPSIENSFSSPAPAVKKDAKKDANKVQNKKRRDEEHLNEMMQVN